MFGHQFRTRFSHCLRNPQSEKEYSPIFILFLDCVYQIASQFPSLLEFNSDFLKEIAFHSQSLLFGTFLCSSEKERKLLNVREKTPSLWSYLNSRKECFVNPFYQTEAVLIDSSQIYVYPIQMRLKTWEELHLRWLMPLIFIQKNHPHASDSTRYGDCAI